jgi:hypothetical protein
MKLALSLTLIVCLLASAFPVAAQETETLVSFGVPSPASPRTTGPLARAITREAVRLVAEPSASAVEAIQQGGKSAASDWSRVRRLAPGTEIIIVTVKGSPSGRRFFVAGDESGLTVLNVDDSALPAAVTGVLRDTAADHPEYFVSVQKGGTFLLDKNVRVAPDGVFVADRKVADLQHVVETSARNEVVEIKTRQKGRGVWGHLGPLGGYFVGGMSGGYVAGFACLKAHCHSDTGPFLVGMLVGGIAGGVYGFHAANRETENVIYRAP